MVKTQSKTHRKWLVLMQIIPIVEGQACHEDLSFSLDTNTCGGHLRLGSQWQGAGRSTSFAGALVVRNAKFGDTGLSTKYNIQIPSNSKMRCQKVTAGNNAKCHRPVCFRVDGLFRAGMHNAQHSFPEAILHKSLAPAPQSLRLSPMAKVSEQKVL